MKKFLVSAIAAAALGANAQAASVLGFEVSPELGVAWGKMSPKEGASFDSFGDLGAYGLARLILSWLRSLNTIAINMAMCPLAIHNTDYQRGITSGLSSHD